MKLELEPTDAFYEVDGTLCRVWKGTTPKGATVYVFVALVALPNETPSAVASELDAELQELFRTPSGASVAASMGSLHVVKAPPKGAPS